MSQYRGDPYAGEYDPTRADYPRSPCEGFFVGILRRSVDDRELKLIKERARCIRAGEIHEFIITDEPDAVAGRIVNRIAYLGFAEFTRGGVILSGDIMAIDNVTVGELAGCDETHMPNHMNIVVRGPQRVAGYDRGIRLGSRFTFTSPYPDARFPAESRDIATAIA